MKPDKNPPTPKTPAEPSLQKTDGPDVHGPSAPLVAASLRESLESAPALPSTSENPEDDDSPQGDEDSLFQILEQYMELPPEQLPSQEEIRTKYPEMADELWNCLRGMALMQGDSSSGSGMGGTATPESFLAGIPGFTPKAFLPTRESMESLAPQTSQASSTVAQEASVRSSVRTFVQEAEPKTARSSELSMEPIGDFQLIQEIGRGGMGVVYEAWQCSLGRKVALKILPLASTFDPRQLQRFQNEAAAAAQLEHPSIVPIYAIGNERGIHYYAMRLINGPHLGTMIQQLRNDGQFLNVPETITRMHKSTNPQAASNPTADTQAPDAVHSTDSDASHSADSAIQEPPSQAHVSTHSIAAVTTQARLLYKDNRTEFYRTAARLMKQAAEALDYAHQCGIVHRDIKPGNLLVEASGRLWITDFGLAHIQSNVQLTQTGEVFGTPRYMSPEQAMGKARLADHRVDIYSLGATFYEFLTLRPMFDEKNQVQLLRKITQEAPLKPHVLDPRIPHDLETILLKTIEKNPADRYETAGELAKDLGRFLDDRPIQAKRPGVLEITWKYLRRHPSILVGFVLLVIAAFVVQSINHHMISVEKQKTTQALAEAQARFQKAREAADTLINLVETDLSNETSPTIRKTRQKLLDTALVLYQDFLTMDELDEETQSQLTASRNYIQRFMRLISDMEGTSLTFLLTNHSVQEDLKLTDEQRQKIRQHFDEMNRRGADQFREMRDLEPDQRLEKMAELVRKNDALLTEVLTPLQSKRLTQIGYQLHIESLCDEQVIRKLQLTEEQVAQIQEKLALQPQDQPALTSMAMNPDQRSPVHDSMGPEPGMGPDRGPGHKPEMEPEPGREPGDESGMEPEFEPGHEPPMATSAEPASMDTTSESNQRSTRQDGRNRGDGKGRRHQRRNAPPQRPGSQGTPSDFEDGPPAPPDDGMEPPESRERDLNSDRNVDHRTPPGAKRGRQENAPPPFPQDREMDRERRNPDSQRRETEILAILTEEQRAAWAEMKGEPIQFQKDFRHEEPPRRPEFRKDRDFQGAKGKKPGANQERTNRRKTWGGPKRNAPEGKNQSGNQTGGKTQTGNEPQTSESNSTAPKL